MKCERVVLALSVADEEDNIINILNEARLKLPGVQHYHILDGYWNRAGPTAYSSDKTEILVQQWADTWQEDIDVMWERLPDGQYFEDEAAKKNYHLERIAACNDDVDYYVIWLDADEELRFRTGITKVWLKDVCDHLNGSIGLIDTYAYDNDLGMKIPRLIPGKKGIHYHTDQIMVLHDKDCNEIVDWKPPVEKIDYTGPVGCIDYSKMFIVNKYQLRNANRQIQKQSLLDWHQVEYYGKSRTCKWQTQSRAS